MPILENINSPNLIVPGWHFRFSGCFKVNLQIGQIHSLLKGNLLRVQCI